MDDIDLPLKSVDSLLTCNTKKTVKSFNLNIRLTFEFFQQVK